MKRKAIVVLSGGQDSTTCLYYAIKHGYEVHAVTFDYGQRHAREIECAIHIARKMAKVASHEVIELGPVLRGTSPLTNPNVKLEQYAGHDQLPGGLEKTFVPMRNQLFLTIAANRAFVLGANRIITGVSQEDYGGYPDCRKVFINALTEACNLGTFTGEPDTAEAVYIATPLINMSKADTVKLALVLPGCYGALAHSHTGYDGAYPPTGKDHATLLRAKGFEQALVPDPMVLRAVKQGMMAYPETSNYKPDRVEFYSQLCKREGGFDK